MDNKYNINLNKKSSGCANGSSCCGGTGEHHHEHEHAGCCGKHKKELDKNDLTEDESCFLNKLLMYSFLPVARFVLKSSKEDDFLVYALSPVYIENENDTLSKVKFNGEILTALNEKGFIDIDYDIDIKNYDYSEYINSNIYKHFQKTVLEGKTQHNFLGDIAEIELGSIAITENCANLFQGEYEFK